MKTKLITLAAALLIAASAWAQTEVNGIYYAFSGTDATVTNPFPYGIPDHNTAYSGSITIPATIMYQGTTYNVTGMETQTFQDCTGLTAVSVPSSFSTINSSGFRGCTNLTSVQLAEGITYIASNAFNGCTNLTSINLPSTLTSIGGSAFRACSKLTSVSLPANLESIAQDAFREAGLTSIIIPNKVSSLWTGAFRDCSSLQSVIISGNIADWQQSAFNNCTALTSVVIQNGVTAIPGSAFKDCTNLSTIVVPNSVASIGTDAFYRTAWYNAQPDGVVYIGKVLYKYKGTMPLNTSIQVTDGTVGIADGAFYASEGLSLTSIQLPNTLVNIGTEAFYWCHGLTSLIVPEGVESIGYRAFSETNITTVTIPSTLKMISSNAFYNCQYLTSITIPSAVTYIDQSAFSGCTALQSIYVLGTTPPGCPPQADYLSAFYNVPKDGVLHVPAGTIALYAGADGWSEFINVTDDASTGTHNPQAKTFATKATLNGISINGEIAGKTVSIFNINGTQVYNAQATTGEITIALSSAGIYIVRIGNEAIKIIKK